MVAAFEEIRDVYSEFKTLNDLHPEVSDFVLLDSLAVKYGKFPHEVEEQMDPYDMIRSHMHDVEKEEARKWKEAVRSNNAGGFS